MPDKHETTGAITLRQTVQTTIQGQAHTFEIALTLPHNATADEMQRAIQQAHIGMQQLSEQLAGHIAGLQAAPTSPQENGHAPTEAANHRAAPPEAGKSDARPMATATESAPLPAEHSTGTGSIPPSAVPEQQAEAAPETPPAKPMSRPVFFREAGALGFKSTEIPKALGVAALADIKDYAVALEQLRQIAQEREAAASEPAPVTHEAPATRGFAEELSAYETASKAEAEEEEAEMHLAGELASLADLDDLDEPDFGPAPEDQEDGVFAPESSSPETPNAHAVQVRGAAQRRLRELRAIRTSIAAPTDEQRKAFMNCVWTPLGKERAQELIKALWNPPPGEKLNAARTRALFEWSKDDDFEEVVAAVIDLAHQAAPEEG